MKRIAAIAVMTVALNGCSKENRPITEHKEEHRDESEAIIEMAAEAQKHVGLQVAPVERKQIVEYLQVTGTVQPIDSLMAQVRPLARGRLQEVNVRVGDRVQGGQTLARMDNMEATELAAQLAAEAAEVQRLRSQITPVARQVERNRRLLELGAVPQKDYEFSVAEQRGIEENIRSREGMVANIQAQLRRFGVSNSSPGQLITTAIVAPFAGVVTKVQAAPGEVIDGEDQLFTVADLSRVWVQAEVYEKDLGRIQVGQNAIIRVDTWPEESFTGKVTYISDVLDPQTRSARVRSEVLNPAVRLKVDMFAKVQVPTKLNRMAIAVPSGSLQQVEARNVVFVRTSETQFEAREVRTGNTVGSVVEIVSGLKEGERIVTEGAFHLKSIMVGRELGEDTH